MGAASEIIRLLLEASADPNAQNDSGSTPLHIAVQIAAYASRPEAPARFSGNTDDSLENIYATIELLLQHGADAATRDNHGQSALFLYLANLIESESYNADPEIVKLLLEHGTEVTAENDTDAMVMTYAMWAGANPEVIRLLLEHGDQAAFRGHDGDTLLHMAAGFTASPRVFELLLENGEDVNGMGAFEWTPLHISVRNDALDPQVIELLLDSGADVTARSDDGTTPLHHAATHSGPAVIRLLLERGADVAARDHWMNTPLHSAMTKGYSDTDYSANPEVVRLLLGSGADVDARNDAGSTPPAFRSRAQTTCYRSTLAGPRGGRHITERLRNHAATLCGRSSGPHDRNPANGPGRRCQRCR